VLAGHAKIPPGSTSRANTILEAFRISPRTMGAWGRLRAAAGQLQELEASKQGAMQEVVIKQPICENLADN